jgi:divalent metal cation (Fe/Co/Zn/Cd) transporter
VAFTVLACYLAVQSTLVLVTGYHPRHSPLGIGWTAATAVVMFTLAAGKDRTGKALENPVLRTEGRVTFVDGLLATAVVAGLVINTVLGWWWADPIAGYVILVYGLKEGRAALRGRDHPKVSHYPTITSIHSNTACTHGCSHSSSTRSRLTFL